MKIEAFDEDAVAPSSADPASVVLIVGAVAILSTASSTDASPSDVVVGCDTAVDIDASSEAVAIDSPSDEEALASMDVTLSDDTVVLCTSVVLVAAVDRIESSTSIPIPASGIDDAIDGVIDGVSDENVSSAVEIGDPVDTVTSDMSTISCPSTDTIVEATDDARVALSVTSDSSIASSAVATEAVTVDVSVDRAEETASTDNADAEPLLATSSTIPLSTEDNTVVVNVVVSAVSVDDDVPSVVI